MGTYGEGSPKASETAANGGGVTKAADVGSAVIVSAIETAGKYGPQLRLRTEDGRTVFISATSGLAKGIIGGKLKLPVEVSTQRGYGPNGPYVFLGLASRAGKALSPTGATTQKTLSGGA